MSRLKSLTHWQERITLAELVLLLAAVLLSYSHYLGSSGQLLVNCCCAVCDTSSSPAGLRLKVLPELLSSACSERETTERRQETTDGWQGAAITKLTQKGESLPTTKMIGVIH